MSYVPTVKIKVQPCKGNESGVVILNESDYDPRKHELYDPAKEAALKAEAEAKKTEEEKAEQERIEKEKAEKEQAEKDKAEPAKEEPKRGRK